MALQQSKVGTTQWIKCKRHENSQTLFRPARLWVYTSASSMLHTLNPHINVYSEPSQTNGSKLRQIAHMTLLWGNVSNSVGELNANETKTAKHCSAMYGFIRVESKHWCLISTHVTSTRLNSNLIPWLKSTTTNLVYTSAQSMLRYFLYSLFALDKHYMKSLMCFACTRPTKGHILGLAFSDQWNFLVRQFLVLHSLCHWFYS